MPARRRNTICREKLLDVLVPGLDVVFTGTAPSRRFRPRTIAFTGKKAASVWLARTKTRSRARPDRAFAKV